MEETTRHVAKYHDIDKNNSKLRKTTRNVEKQQTWRKTIEYIYIEKNNKVIEENGEKQDMGETTVYE